MSDTRRFHAILRDRKAVGFHSHDARREGISGNPSQRAKDLATEGVKLAKMRENVGHRQGVRFWLAEHGPLEAVPVAPNHDFDGRDRQVRGAGSDEPTPAGSARPAHITGSLDQAVTAEYATGPPSRNLDPDLGGEPSVLPAKADPPSRTTTRSSVPAAELSAEEMATVYDYRGSEPTEYEVPVSELGAPVQMGLGEAE